MHVRRSSVGFAALCAMMAVASACRLPTSAHPGELPVEDALAQDAAVGATPATGGAGSPMPANDTGAMHAGTGGAIAPAHDAGTQDGGTMVPPPPTMHPSNSDASAPHLTDSAVRDAQQPPTECTPELAFDFAACLTTDPLNPDCVLHAGPCAPGLSGDASVSSDGGA